MGGVCVCVFVCVCGCVCVLTSLGLATYVMLDPVDGTSLMGWVGDGWGGVNVPWTCNLRDA